MATSAIAVLTTSVTADTNATANTLVTRDSAGGIYGTTVSGSAVVSTGTLVGTVSTKTSNFTLGSATDYLVDATSSAVTATMPTASANTGVVYWVMKKDSSGNAVTISGASGTTSLSSQYDRARIVSDGTSWYSK